MKRVHFALLFLGLSFINVTAQENCLNPENLKALDASWEKAQLELNYAFLESLLAEDFLWVHNHANTIDDKSAVLNRVKRHLSTNNRNTKSRTSKDVKIIIYGATAVVNGTTIVDRGPKPTAYNFMRTYTQINGKCYLLANHTMAVPDSKED